MKRKIAAIFAADVVGYSRMIAEDEEDTLQCLGPPHCAQRAKGDSRSKPESADQHEPNLLEAMTTSPTRLRHGTSIGTCREA